MVLDEWDLDTVGELRGAGVRGDGGVVMGLLARRDPAQVNQLAGDGLLVATAQGHAADALPLLAELVHHALLDWADAATLRRRTRRRGRPVRSVSDALMATVAVRTGTPVLAADRDFAHLAAVSDLQLLEP